MLHSHGARGIMHRMQWTLSRRASNRYDTNQPTSQGALMVNIYETSHHSGEIEGENFKSKMATQMVARLVRGRGTKLLKIKTTIM